MEKELLKIKSKLSMPIDKDYELKDFLNNMTKDELNNIRKKLEVKGASSLTKPQLIDKLEDAIKSRIPEILHNITEKEYYMILMMLPKSGMSIVNIEEDLQLNMSTSLRNWGIVYTGKINDVIFSVIPRDIFSALKESMEDSIISNSISNRQKWIRTISGLLYFYGALEKEELYNMTLEILEEEKSFEDFINITDIACKNGNLIKSEGNIYSYYKVENPEYIIEKHKKTPVDCKELDIRIIYTFGMEDIFNWNNVNKQMYTYLLEVKKLDPTLCENIVRECGFMINNEKSKDEIIDFIKESTNGLNEVDEVVVNKLIKSLSEETPLWILKGYSKAEVLKNIGRNDLCYCGSGKKYKKCCE